MKIIYNNQKILFIIISVLYCGFLSFRPLPAAADLNDTGRYLYNFFTMCKSDSIVFGRDTSNILFNAILSPICVLESPKTFLFIIAIIIPFGIFLFTKVGEGRLFILVAMLINTYTFEFMTNALRQGFSYFFLLWTLSCLINNKKYFTVLLGIFSILLHSSVVMYFPFIILVLFKDSLKKIIKLKFYLFTLFIMLFFSLYFILKASDTFDFYQAIYVQQLGIAFLIFIILPHHIMYLIRYYYSKNYISALEKWHFIYSNILYVGCYLLFPAIVYRLPMTLVLIQLFYATYSKRVKLIEGLIIFIVFLCIFIMYFAMSSRVLDAVFFVQSSDYI